MIITLFPKEDMVKKVDRTAGRLKGPKILFDTREFDLKNTEYYNRI